MKKKNYLVESVDQKYDAFQQKLYMKFNICQTKKKKKKKNVKLNINHNFDPKLMEDLFVKVVKVGVLKKNFL